MSAFHSQLRFLAWDFGSSCAPESLAGERLYCFDRARRLTDNTPVHAQIDLVTGGMPMTYGKALSQMAVISLMLLVAVSEPRSSLTRLSADDTQPKPASVKVGAWNATAPFKDPRTAHQGFVYRDFLYVCGGYFYSDKSGVVAYNDVQFAPIVDDGKIKEGAWRATEPFKTARSGHGCAVFNKRLYVVGGGDGAKYFGDVQYAPLNDDGTITAKTWQTSTASLNVPRSVIGCLVFIVNDQPYLYAVGGVGEVDKKTVHFDTVEYAPINKDGSLGKWSLSKNRFQKGRSSPVCVISNRNLYVIGGWGDDLNDIFSDIQVARLQDNGEPGEWTTRKETIEPGRYGHAGVVWSRPTPPALLVLGGNAGKGNYLNDVQYASLKAGQLGPFTKVPEKNFFPSPRWGHAAVVHKDRLYVIGGSAKGVFLNDVQVAPLESE
jgi:hypothetical protein